MCDVCAFEGNDSEKLNGNKKGNRSFKIYGANSGSINQLNLCYYHELQFYLKGESLFLAIYPKLLRSLGVTRNEVSYL